MELYWCLSELWHCLILLGVLKVSWFYATLIIFVDIINNNNNNKRDLLWLQHLICNIVLCVRACVCVDTSRQHRSCSQRSITRSAQTRGLPSSLIIAAEWCVTSHVLYVWLAVSFEHCHSRNTCVYSLNIVIVVIRVLIASFLFVLCYVQWRCQNLLQGGTKMEIMSWGTDGELQGRVQQLLDD